ncbi:MAG TPA: hypothetical protein VH062_17595 [Polyangiaceae bacterium]|jgi:hypothetical protein|nr:hypothetical protein [Polyangiaceae bacterium]
MSDDGAAGATSTVDAAEGRFEHQAGFERAEVGGLTLGPLESQYEELFAEVLEDGVITSEERERLEKAADNLGLDRRRLLKLEQAMVASYESHNRVRVIERFEEPARTLSPIEVARAGDAGRTVLEKRIEQLEARIRELEDELRVARANVNVEVDLSDLDTAAEDATEDPEEEWRRIRRDPLKPDGYRRLFRIHGARGEVDRRWCAAQALVALGQATDEERAVYAERKSSALIAPRASLSAAAWYDHLFHPDEEVLTGQIFGVIAPAVLIGRVTSLRRDKTLHIPDPTTRQQIEKSTLTAVRALGWSAAILGLAPPPIFVEKNRETAFQHVPAVPPITVVGHGALSGRTQLELAFLSGRHLAWYRQEHFVRTLFSSVADLEDLFLAALVVGSPRLPIAADVKHRVAPIARAIEPLLEPPQLDALRGHFLRFVEEGGRTNLQRWSSGAEKTASRAGFLLSNDLPTALSVLEAEEGRLGELAKDLLVFSTSERYSKLRRQLGVSLS